jgi:two-component system response regulator FlrC
LSVFPLRIPPLRDRPADIAALARRFVAGRSLDGVSRPLSSATLARMLSHSWPGNVRELENVMQRALLLSEGASAIEPQHLVLDAASSLSPIASPPQPITAGLAGELWEEETRRIVTALETSRGSRKSAAAQLGISDRTLRYKLSKIRAAGVSVPGDRA